MITLKCENCGGEMSVNWQGELICPYCGSSSHLSDIEYNKYKTFRLNFLNFLRASADRAEQVADESFFWNNYSERATYTTADGSSVVIDYMFFNDEDNTKMYVARNSVIYVFSSENKDKAVKMQNGLSMLDYPSADIKNLSKYFPSIKSIINLDNGGVLVAIDKPENVYPLFAFGNLRPEHVAWIISRMENFCCVFEFSGIVHGGLSLNSVFLNPRTHEAYLYGNWWKARKKINSLDRIDLYDLRKVASLLVGSYKSRAPEEFQVFLSSHPKSDAYKDFEFWDEVIEKGFGGHYFTKFSLKQ